MIAARDRAWSVGFGRACPRGGALVEHGWGSWLTVRGAQAG
jgi:hypothetical protein